MTQETAILWNLTAGDSASVPSVLRGCEESIRSATINLDAHWLATGGERETYCAWDVATGRTDERGARCRPPGAYGWHYRSQEERVALCSSHRLAH